MTRRVVQEHEKKQMCRGTMIITRRVEEQGKQVYWSIDKT